jgi:hypothetical protein
MSPENLSRRSILAGAASVPALALPTVASASTEPDPIFAAIEAHRRGHAEYVVLCNNDETDCDPAVDDAYQVSESAAMGLTAIRPTTVVGAAALLSYFADVNAKRAGPSLALARP